MSEKEQKPKINNLFTKKNVEYSLSTSHKLPYSNSNDFNLNENQIVFTAINNLLNRLVENDLYNSKLVDNVVNSSQYRSPKLITDPGVILQKIGGNEKFIVNDKNNPNSDLSIVFRTDADLDHSVITEKYSSVPQHLLEGKYVYFVFNFNGLYFAGTDDGFWQSPNRYTKEVTDIGWHRCDPSASVGGFGASFEGQKVTAYAFNSNIGKDDDIWPMNKYQFILAVDNELYGYYPIKSLCGKKDNLPPFKKILALPTGTVINKLFCNTDDGMTYIATTTGLYCLNGKAGTTAYYAPGTFRKNVYDIIYLKDVEEPRERIMLATSGGILQSHVDKTFKDIKVETVFSNSIRTMLGDNGNVLFVGTDSGIFKKVANSYKQIPANQTNINYVNPLNSSVIDKMIYLDDYILVVSSNTPGIFRMNPTSGRVDKITKVHNDDFLTKSFKDISILKYSDKNIIFVTATDGTSYLAIIKKDQIGSEKQIVFPNGLKVNDIYINESEVYFMTNNGVWNCRITGFEQKVDIELNSGFNFEDGEKVLKTFQVDKDVFICTEIDSGESWKMKLYKNSTHIHTFPVLIDPEELRSAGLEIYDIVPYKSKYVLCTNRGIFWLFDEDNESKLWTITLFDEETSAFNNKKVVGFCHYRASQNVDFEVVVIQAQAGAMQKLHIYYKNIGADEQAFSLLNNLYPVADFYKCYAESSGIVLIYNYGNKLEYRVLVEKLGSADIQPLEEYDYTQIVAPTAEVEAKYSAAHKNFEITGGTSAEGISLVTHVEDSEEIKAYPSLKNIESIVFADSIQHNSIDGFSNTSQEILYLKDTDKNVYAVRPTPKTKQISDFDLEINDLEELNPETIYATTKGVYWSTDSYSYADHIAEVPYLKKVDAFGTSNYKNILKINGNRLFIENTSGNKTNVKSCADFYIDNFNPDAIELNTLKTYDFQTTDAWIANEQVTGAYSDTESIVSKSSLNSFDVVWNNRNYPFPVPLEFIKNVDGKICGYSPVFGSLSLDIQSFNQDAVKASKASAVSNASTEAIELDTNVTIKNSSLNPTTIDFGSTASNLYTYSIDRTISIDESNLTGVSTIQNGLENVVIDPSKLSASYKIFRLECNGNYSELLAGFNEISSSLSIELSSSSNQTKTYKVKPTEISQNDNTVLIEVTPIIFKDAVADLHSINIALKKNSDFLTSLSSLFKETALGSTIIFSYPYTSREANNKFLSCTTTIEKTGASPETLDGFNGFCVTSLDETDPELGKIFYGIPAVEVKVDSVEFPTKLKLYAFKPGTTLTKPAFVRDFLYLKKNETQTNKYQVDVVGDQVTLQLADENIDVQHTPKNIVKIIGDGNQPYESEHVVAVKPIVNAPYEERPEDSNIIFVSKDGKVFSREYLLDPDGLAYSTSEALTNKRLHDLFKTSSNGVNTILCPYITGEGTNTKAFFAIFDDAKKEIVSEIEIKTINGQSIPKIKDLAIGVMETPLDGALTVNGINYMTVVVTDHTVVQSVETVPSYLYINGIEYDNSLNIKNVYSHNNSVYAVDEAGQWYLIVINDGKYVLTKDNRSFTLDLLASDVKKLKVSDDVPYVQTSTEIKKINVVQQTMDTFIAAPAGQFIDFYVLNEKPSYAVKDGSNYYFTTNNITYESNKPIRFIEGGLIFSETAELTIQDFIIYDLSKFTLNSYPTTQVKYYFENGNVETFAIDGTKLRYVYCVSFKDFQGFNHYILGSSNEDFNGLELEAKINGIYKLNSNNALITGSLNSYIFDLTSGSMFTVLTDPLKSILGTIIDGQIDDAITIGDKTYIAYNGIIISFDADEFEETLKYVPPFGIYRCFADKFKDATYRIVRCVDDDDFLIGDELGLCYVINRRIFRRFPNFLDSKLDLFDIDVKVVEAVKDKDNSYTYLAAANNLIFQSTAPEDGFNLTLESVVNSGDIITGIYHEGKNNYVICTSNGIYNTEFNYMIENELGDGSLARFHSMVRESVKAAVSKHINRLHGQAALLTLLNNKEGTDLANFPFKSDNNLVYNSSKSINHIKNDIVKTIEYENEHNYIRAGVKNPAMQYLKAKTTYATGFYDTFIDSATKEEVSLKNIPYIAKFFQSGLKEIDIFVPTTATYYQNNVDGFSGSKYAQASIPRPNIGSGATFKNAVNTNSTKMRLYIYNGHFGIKNIISVQITGSSLPLKIYQDNTYYQEGRAGMFDTVIQPSIMTSLPQSIDEKPQNVKLITDEQNRICLDFEIYGTDAQSIRILAE